MRDQSSHCTLLFVKLSEPTWTTDQALWLRKPWARANKFEFVIKCSASVEIETLQFEVSTYFKMGDIVPIYYHIIAFICTVGATALAVFHIYRHLLNYTEPTYQRYIVPHHFYGPSLHFPEVYALMSFLALVLPDSAIYFNSIREV
ncbi:hypothetical protein Patl1_24658 [Pistacia atlantica]|uniref:Uncharacterized protein n=1 Tax=Pistacia atlantica TaxID=434234 RepID=A0ACC1A015_9ROSI|nr:hypothetical protein Patl1_24658 [Pistacia atlantica]